MAVAPDMPDPVALTKALIACPSVTPAAGAVFDVLADALMPLGFAIDRFASGDPPDGPVENMLAVRGTGAPHVAFGGHVDVVPAGAGWQGDAFVPEQRAGVLHGRGAVDMKGAVAAFVAAVARIPADAGTISLIITGDEEGPAIHGTRALIERMAARGIRPDFCLVGEPTSVDRLGDTIKIGRRGSVNIWIDVPGQQGHVAYPHLADNPITRLIAMLGEIDGIELDRGTGWFQPSNIEITDIEVGNPAHNVIPGRAQARLSIRFNDRHRGADLARRIEAIVQAHAPTATTTALVSGEAFLTEPGPLSDAIGDAIEAVTGERPQLSTSGGTSDARFLSRLCPVVEFGLVNATMHKIDEGVAIDDLQRLADIYEALLRRLFIR